jgi:hypothetical protein
MSVMASLPVMVALARDFATNGYVVVRHRWLCADDPAESGRGPQETMSEDLTTLNAVAREELAHTLTLAADDVREPLTSLQNDVAAGRRPDPEDVAAALREVENIQHLLGQLERATE